MHRLELERQAEKLAGGARRASGAGLASLHLLLCLRCGTADTQQSQSDMVAVCLAPGTSCQAFLLCWPVGCPLASRLLCIHTSHSIHHPSIHSRTSPIHLYRCPPHCPHRNATRRR
jgi:hypothetical protein